MNMNTITKTLDGKILTPLQDEFLANRKIFIRNEINNETAEEILMQLMYLNEMDSKEPITIYINCPGGEVRSGLVLYDYIRLMKAPVTTVCTGLAASMASLLFLAGTERKMYEHSCIMVHDPSYGGNGAGCKAIEYYKKAKSLMDMRDIAARIISERTGNPLEEVYNMTKEDTYLNAEEALKLNFATEIVKTN